jgi:hypothetical protein
MTASLSQRRARAIFTAVIVVALAAAGWFMYRHRLEDTSVKGPVTGATLVWRPGMNTGGAEGRTSADDPAARRLARLVNDTPELPTGTINCPADFGSQVIINFHDTGHQDQRVTIALTGCAGPSGRIMTDALRNDLEHLAPPGFWPENLR